MFSVRRLSVVIMLLFNEVPARRTRQPTPNGFGVFPAGDKNRWVTGRRVGD
jgi:hypothetical protein